MRCIECELLSKEIEQLQRKPYIILKHEGKFYKAYELEQITSDESQPLVSGIESDSCPPKDVPGGG